MNVVKRISTAFAILFLLMMTIGCASTVYIDSEPPGATVMVDGQHVGETPTSYTDTAIAYTSRQIVLEKEGYRTTRTQLRRDGNVNAVALAGGIFGAVFCLLGAPLLLWSMDYPANVHYNMREDSSAGGVDGDDDSITFVLQPIDTLPKDRMGSPIMHRYTHPGGCYVCAKNTQ